MLTEALRTLEQTEPALTAHILAIDDDPSVRKMIEDYLGDNELRVTTLASGREMAQLMERETIDLVVLDWRMPGEDGMQIARRLRADSHVPIIMLTGRKDEADRVMGLELGADDYLTKPFSPRELLARIRALLRRARAQQTVADGLQKVRAYRFAGFELNVRLRRLAAPGGANVALTNSEFNLLAAFLASPQRVLSRDQLLGLSRLHNDEVYDRSVDVQIGRLRRKIQPRKDSAELIRTERGAGYVFTAPVEIVR
jgi:two-component system OmpR family response regulator